MRVKKSCLKIYIYDKWDWDVKYPIIKIDFFGDLRSAKSLKRTIFGMLRDNQEGLGVKCDDENIGVCLKELIKLTYEKYNQQVVVLIDEYDKKEKNISNFEWEKLD